MTFLGRRGFASVHPFTPHSKGFAYETEVLVGAGRQVMGLTLPFIVAGIVLNILFPAWFALGFGTGGVIAGVILLVIGVPVWISSVVLILGVGPAEEADHHRPVRRRPASPVHLGGPAGDPRSSACCSTRGWGSASARSCTSRPGSSLPARKRSSCSISRRNTRRTGRKCSFPGSEAGPCMRIPLPGLVIPCAVTAVLVAIAWVGLSIAAPPFPAFHGAQGTVETIPFPKGLPAPGRALLP